MALLFKVFTNIALLFQTYIGPVLISVNPYRELNIYTQEHVKEYANKHFFETSPHMCVLTIFELFSRITVFPTIMTTTIRK